MSVQNTKSSRIVWLLLAYKVPPEPSKSRVAIWRRIKSYGAVYIQSSVCLLPKTTDHQRQLKILQNDIQAAGGEAAILETVGLDPQQENFIIERFKQDRDAEYKEFLGKCSDYLIDLRKEVKQQHFTYAELQENDEDLRKLRDWLVKIKALDFYGAPSRIASEEQLAECERMLEAFADEVFEREQQGKMPITQVPAKPRAKRQPR